MGSVLCDMKGPPSVGCECVFVDSEPKVVAPLVTDGSPNKIPWLPPSSIAYDHNGRGNNWAWGYNSAASRLGEPVGSNNAAGRVPGGPGCSAGRQKKPLLDRALDCVRKQVS